MYATDKIYFYIIIYEIPRVQILKLGPNLVLCHEPFKPYSFLSHDQVAVNPIRSRGGQYCPPPDFSQALQQKLEEPVTWIFLTFPKYVYTLTLNKKNYNVNPDRLAERDVKSAGQDILCIFWTNLHWLWCIISISSCTCLNTLKFGHRFHF